MRNMMVVAIVAILTASSLASGSAQNLLTNPGFESGLTGWTTFGEGWYTNGGADAHSGKYGAVDSVLPTQQLTDNWRGVYQTLSAAPYQEYTASCWIRTVSISHSHAFLEIQFQNSSGTTLQQYDTPAVTVTQPYTFVQFPELVAPPNTAKVCVRGIVNMLSLPTSGEWDEFDDFNFSVLNLPSNTTSYLQGLASDTWNSINSMVDPTTGLPYDTSAHLQFTSVTNIGLYLTDICAAYDMGIINSATATSKISAVLTSVQRFQTWYGFQACWNAIYTANGVNSLQPQPGTVVSTLDSGNLAAGLMTVAEAFPQYATQCNTLVDAMNIPACYDSSTKFLFGGYDIYANPPAFQSGWDLNLMGADSQMICFLGVGEGTPMSTWNNLNRTQQTTHCVSFYTPSYTAGGLFMQYLSALWMKERQTPLGYSAGNFACDQIGQMGTLNMPVWGWSACNSSTLQYVNGWQNPGETYYWNVVAPYASALAIRDNTPAVVTNLQTLDSLGARDNTDHYGFYDGYDATAKKSANIFLMLDQSMILISVSNYLMNGDINNYFSNHPIAQAAYTATSNLSY